MIDTPIRTLIIEELLRTDRLTPSEVDARIRYGRGVAMAKSTVKVEMYRMYHRGEATRERRRYSLTPTTSTLEAILDAALRLDPEIAARVLERNGWRKVGQ